MSSLFTWLNDALGGLRDFLVPTNRVNAALVILVVAIIVVGTTPTLARRRHNLWNRGVRVSFRIAFMVAALLAVVTLEYGSGALAEYVLVGVAAVMATGAAIGVAASWFHRRLLTAALWVVQLLGSLALGCFGSALLASGGFADWLHRQENDFLVAMAYSIVVFGILMMLVAADKVFYRISKMVTKHDRRPGFNANTDEQQPVVGHAPLFGASTVTLEDLDGVKPANGGTVYPGDSRQGEEPLVEATVKPRPRDDDGS